MTRKSKTVPEVALASGVAQSVEGRAAQNELAQFCLELDPVEANRGLAWMNAICMVYVLVGALGLNPVEIVVTKKAPVAEEPVPIAIEPLTPPTPQQADSNPQEQPPDRPVETGPASVAVTLDSPEVAFSVPTIGNVLVPLNVAQAPPSNPMQGVKPVTAPKIEVADVVTAPTIEQITITGLAGSRPPPTYPYESLRKKEEGTVVLHIEVDGAGRVQKVIIKQTSGFERLDQAAAEAVRRHWFFEPGRAMRLYECPIVFRLQ